ncbi:MAG TPA: hypothetical protein VME69_03185 [Methylocella sp.]|nr:hypothetical protein [Methylocella sp.]
MKIGICRRVLDAGVEGIPFLQKGLRLRANMPLVQPELREKERPRGPVRLFPFVRSVAGVVCVIDLEDAMLTCEADAPL